MILPKSHPVGLKIQSKTWPVVPTFHACKSARKEIFEKLNQKSCVKMKLNQNGLNLTSLSKIQGYEKDD